MQLLAQIDKGCAIVGEATSSALNVSSNTVVKASSGKVATVVVTAALSTAGVLHDCTTVGAAAAGNTVFAIPATTGVYTLNFPMQNGIVVKPGSGQTIAISYV